MCSCFRGLVPLVALLASAASYQPLSAQITAEQVRTAVAGGVRFLKEQQNRTTGGWREYTGYTGGLPALCTLALLSCGEDPQSPAMQSALAYQRAIEPEMTYAVALQTMVFCAAEPEKDRLLIRRNVKWLEQTQITTGFRNGAWKYSAKQGFGDNSNTQFALLALHEAERVGVDVDEATWRRSLAYWQRIQNADGSWSYTPPDPEAQISDAPTGSMTCAGISSLVICQSQVAEADARVEQDQVRCCGQQEDDNALARGLLWLGSKFTVNMNPGGDGGWLLYYLYGVERVGRLTGRRFIGQHDWYRAGAEVLVADQDRLSGFWRGSGHAESDPLVGTSLALLFLSKGMRPVVVGKLKHGDEDDWNAHRNGIHNLTQRIEANWKQYLTWQTIDIGAASVEDLLEAPVLFISGRNALNLTAEQKQNLQRYVQAGGFIFAEASDGFGCDGKAFDASFRELMTELFPDAALRLLPPDHPVWYAEQKVDPDRVRPLYGIEACCRTSVVYCPETLACFWDLNQQGRAMTYSEDVQQEIEACLRIGANVVAYATNRQLKDKLERPRILADLPQPELARGALTVTKLAHSGGSDDAPNALRNLLEGLGRELDLRVDQEQRMISPGDFQLYDHPLAFMHGRNDFHFTPDERQALAQYLERGGFLFADAICGSPQFAEAFRREMGAMFPDQELKRIPLDHPIFGGRYRGFELAEVSLRDPQMRANSGERLEARLVKTSPLLEGIEIDGRLAVVFSPYDISCALEHHASLECKGYTTEDAQRLGMNIILFALQQ